MAKPWKLEDGLRLVRLLQGEAKSYGYHIALGGGVLNKGESDKDLDLYFLPLENDQVAKASPDELVKWLRGMWGEAERIGAAYDEPQPDGPAAARVPDWPQLNWPQFEMFLDAQGNQRVRPVRREPQGGFVNWDIETTKPKSTSTPTKFLHKLKFIRPDGDRIDVFIL